MNVYLDNNVYVDIEYRELNLLDFISKDNASYYYSSEIIDELFFSLKDIVISIIFNFVNDL